MNGLRHQFSNVWLRLVFKPLFWQGLHQLLGGQEDRVLEHVLVCRVGSGHVLTEHTLSWGEGDSCHAAFIPPSTEKHSHESPDLISRATGSFRKPNTLEGHQGPISLHLQDSSAQLSELADISNPSAMSLEGTCPPCPFPLFRGQWCPGWPSWWMWSEMKAAHRKA